MLFKTILLTILLVTPYTLLANKNIDVIIEHYNHAENSKIGNFSLGKKFNVVTKPDQKMSMLLSKRITDFLKTKGINNAVRSNISSTRNIIINHLDMIENYGRGEHAYRIKVTRDNIIIEYTSSMSLYWAYDAFIIGFVDKQNIITKVIKNKRFFIKEMNITSNEGKESVSDMIRISSETLTIQRIKNHIDKAATSNILTIYIELLSKKYCKLNSRSINVFNPNGSFASKDAITVEELESLNQYALSVGVTIVPVLDFSSADNEKFISFVGHKTFSVEGLRFSRAILNDLCKGTSLTQICLGRKINDKLIQLKYIDPLVDMLHKNGKRAVVL